MQSDAHYASKVASFIPPKLNKIFGCNIKFCPTECRKNLIFFHDWNLRSKWRSEKKSNLPPRGWTEFYITSKNFHFIFGLCRMNIYLHYRPFYLIAIYLISFGKNPPLWRKNPDFRLCNFFCISFHTPNSNRILMSVKTDSDFTPQYWGV